MSLAALDVSPALDLSRGNFLFTEGSSVNFRHLPESMRDTVATVAIQRRLRTSITELEGLDPQSSLLSEYRKLNARALHELTQIRKRMELVLGRPNLTDVERRIATRYLILVSLGESELATGTETAH